MSDVIRILKLLIKNDPRLKEQLLKEGAIEERGDEIIILSPEVFEKIRIEWVEVDRQ